MGVDGNEDEDDREGFADQMTLGISWMRSVSFGLSFLVCLARANALLERCWTAGNPDDVAACNADGSFGFDVGRSTTLPMSGFSAMEAEEKREEA